MDKPQEEIFEDISLGTAHMDRAWMADFWEMFTECVIEMDAQYTVTNLRHKADSTFAEEDAIGKSFLDIVAYRDKAFVSSELESLKTATAPYARFSFQSRQGKYYRFTLSAFTRDGAFFGCHGVAMDVTVQTLNEITLNWQRAIIEGGGDFVSIADMEGRVLYTNPGAYQMTGYAPSEGVLLPERIYEEKHLRAVLSEGMAKVMQEGVWIGVGEIIRQDGKPVPIEHTMFSVRNEQDEAILIASIIRDISVFLEHERTIEEARQAAEAANVAKSEFLSRMSHEIRTPMNAIIGMIGIGLNAADVERKDYCLTRADSASKHLLGIVNDILDMSKIEADKFELSYNVFDFGEMIKTIADMANVRAEEKQQVFITDLAADVPAFLYSDELRLSQVITNLLTNAIKFTPEEGKVVLGITKTGEEGDGVILRFEIADNGIGISKEQQSKLFTSFNQADASISQNFGGTGLGLAISQRIVQLMGGEIRIESELGEGAKFIFALKIKKADDKDSADMRGEARDRHKRSYDFHGRSILIAEDVEINREIMSAILEETGASIDFAENGRLAVDLFVANHEKYNLILMDINMPEMDGYESARQIRALHVPKA
ncbi:MAG: ATP-binding protein, partial [Clostridiales bacterium]|nr:ATP-binding protein [Clostridiales bacterium]